MGVAAGGRGGGILTDEKDRKKNVEF